MTLVTQAEFAKLHGVSRKTVTKWKDGDYLVLSDGKVDVGASDALLKERHLGRFGKSVTSSFKGNKAGNSPKPLPASKPRGGKVDRPSDGYRDDEDPDREGELDFYVRDTDSLIENVLAGNYLKGSEAERIKENNVALKHVLDMRERAGSLVETERAETLFFETARRARDAWMDWPTKIGPMIARDLDIEADKVVEVLTKYVQSQLEKLGDPSSDLRGEAG